MYSSRSDSQELASTENGAAQRQARPESGSTRPSHVSVRRPSISSTMCATAASRQSSMTSVPEAIFYKDNSERSFAETASRAQSTTSSNYVKNSRIEKNRPPPPPRNNSDNSSIVPRMMWQPPQPLSAPAVASEPVAAPVIQDKPIASAVRINSIRAFDDEPVKRPRKPSCCGEFVQRRKLLIILTGSLLIISISVLTFAIVFVSKSGSNDDDNEIFCGDACYDEHSQIICHCDCFDDGDTLPYQGCHVTDGYYLYDDGGSYSEDEARFDDSVLTSECPPLCHRVQMSPDWNPENCRSHCYNDLWEFSVRYNDWLESNRNNHNKREGNGSNNQYTYEDDDDDETVRTQGTPSISDKTSIFNQQPQYDDYANISDCPKFCHRQKLHFKWNPDDCRIECYSTTEDYLKRWRGYEHWQNTDDGGEIEGGGGENENMTTGTVGVVDTRNGSNSP